jgi:uncharacterized membrane protein
MSLARKTALSFIALTGSFVVVRMLMAKSPTDAFRAFGASMALFSLTQWPIWAEGSRWQEKFKSVMDSLLGISPRAAFFIILLWLLATHAIVGWGIHPWQGFDIGFFVQATHNAFSGKGLMFKNIDGDMSFFAHHFSPFLFLLAPLAALREAPIWLYAAQDAVLAATFALIFGRIQRLLDVPTYAKAAMVLALLTHPFWSGLKYYEFHELSFAPLPMFFLLLGWERKSPWMLILATLALLSIKETTCFSLAWFGIVVLGLSREIRMRATGVAVLVLAVGIWILYFKAILPSIAGRSESMFVSYYGHLGNSMLEVALSPAQRPADFLKALFNASNAVYLLTMFAFCIPFLDKPRHLLWLVPVLPDFAMALLSRYEGIRHPGNQYAGLVVVPVMFVVISGLASWNQWTGKRRQLTTAWLMLAAGATMSTNPLKVWKATFWGASSAHGSRDFVNRLRAVPKSESIVVTEGTLLPFAAQRDNLIWIANATNSSTLPAAARWAAFQSPRIPSWKERCSAEQMEWQGFVLCRLN